MKEKLYVILLFREICFTIVVYSFPVSPAPGTCCFYLFYVLLFLIISKNIHVYYNILKLSFLMTALCSIQWMCHCIPSPPLLNI